MTAEVGELNRHRQKLLRKTSLAGTDHNQRVYDGQMTAHQKSVLRDMLEKDDRFWVREAADFIRGFDDGEEQTTVDYNHYNGEER